jgi:hypothetical protein
MNIIRRFLGRINHYLDQSLKGFYIGIDGRLEYMGGVLNEQKKSTKSKTRKKRRSKKS